MAVWLVVLPRLLRERADYYFIQKAKSLAGFPRIYLNNTNHASVEPERLYRIHRLRFPTTAMTSIKRRQYVIF